MKKTLFLVGLLGLSLIFVGCNKQLQQNNNTNENEQPVYTEDLNNTNTELNNEEFNNEEVNYEEVNYEPEIVIQEPQYITDTHEEMTFEEIGDALSRCDELWEEQVCWKDWGTYYNRCYLDFAWIEESTEASIVDWICVF